MSGYFESRYLGNVEVELSECRSVVLLLIAGLLNVEMMDTKMGLLLIFAVNAIRQLWK